MSISKKCREILNGLKQAKAVSSTGTAIVGQDVLDTLKSSNIAVTVIRPIRIRRNDVRLTEYELSFDGLDEVFSSLDEPETTQPVPLPVPPSTVL